MKQSFESKENARTHKTHGHTRKLKLKMCPKCVQDVSFTCHGVVT